jgi:hypothetical protein
VCWWGSCALIGGRFWPVGHVVRPHGEDGQQLDRGPDRVSNRRGSREIEHIGSAHTPAEVEILKTIARQRMHANQDALDFGDGQPGDEEAPIVSSRAKHLWEVLCTAYGVLGLDQACGEDEVFKLLALARVVEPVSKLELDPGADRDRDHSAVVSDDQASAAGLCDRGVAPAARAGVRSACRVGSGDLGDL